MFNSNSKWLKTQNPLFFCKTGGSKWPNGSVNVPACGEWIPMSKKSIKKEETGKREFGENPKREQKKVNIHQNSGCKLRRTSHAGSPRLRTDRGLAAYCAGSSSFLIPGRTWGSGKVHAGCLQIALILTKDDSLMSRRGEAKLKSKNAGRSDGSKNPGLLCAFGDDYGRYFSTDRSAKAWLSDLSDSDPDTYQSVVDIFADQFRRWDAREPWNLRKNRYASFSLIGHDHQRRSIAGPKYWNTGGIPSWQLRANASDLSGFKRTQNRYAPPTTGNLPRLRAEGLRTVDRSFRDPTYPRGKSNLSGVRSAANWWRNRPHADRRSKSLVSPAAYGNGHSGSRTDTERQAPE